MTEYAVARKLSQTPTLEDIRQWPATCSVVSAGAALRMGRNKSYDMARRNKFPIPVVALGRRYQCVTSDLIRFLEGEKTETQHECTRDMPPGKSSPR